MRKKELLTRIEALERQVAAQAALIEQQRVRTLPFGPLQPTQPQPVVTPNWSIPMCCDVGAP